jgi:uncharacterized membrane protein
VGEATISADLDTAATEADGSYDSAIDLSFEDAPNGLKYALKRVAAVMRLSERDEEELRRLVRLAVEELDVRDAANAITGRADANPVAVALAKVVAAARGSKRSAACGAIFGVYVAFRLDSQLAGVIGAVAGAVAASTVAFADERADVQFLLRDL